MEINELIINSFKESANIKLSFLQDNLEKIKEVGLIISKALSENNKVLLFGNGGSAADSQHIAAEIVGRYKKERKGLPAIALTTDTSILTAVGNDYGFERIFERQVEALCNPGDIVIGISTSGNSPNVIKGILKAKELGATTIGFTGQGGGKMRDIVHYIFMVPSTNTPRIQECHITLGHVLCEIIDVSLNI